MMLLVLVAVAALTACAASGASEDKAGVAENPAPEATFRPSLEQAADDSVDNERGQAAPVDVTVRQQERLVIKNATLTTVVEDPEQALDDISVMAEEMGGWVVSSSASQYASTSGKELTRGYITIRIPSGRFTEAVNRIKDAALSVPSDEVTGQDVTQEYTDLQSQIRNLQAAEAQLQEIMDSATRVSDVLDVYNELVNVRGQIETLQGRVQFFEESAAFSSISVTLLPEPEPEKRESEDEKWKPLETVENAFDALVSGLQVLVDTLIWGAICLLPMALLFGAPSWFGYRYVRRRYHRPSRQTPPSDK
jgi:hypothetical protein